MPKLRSTAALIGAAFLMLSPLSTLPAIAASETGQTSVTSGLTREVYSYDVSITPERQAYTLCETSVVPNMDFSAGLGEIACGQSDYTLIHWTGYITLPESLETTLISAADDGFYLSLDDEIVINDWIYKGCYGSSAVRSFEAGVSQKLDAWYFEGGGGACNSLSYTDVNGSQQLIPDSFFTIESQTVVPPIDPPVDPTDPTDPVVPNPEPTPKSDDSKVTVTPVVPTQEVTEEVTVEQAPSFLTADPDSIDPKSLTPEELAMILSEAHANLETADENSPEYKKALAQLMLVARADDIEVDEALASTPVIGAVAVAIVDAINALGNVGADMSPARRELATKEAVIAIVILQIVGRTNNKNKK